MKMNKIAINLSLSLIALVFTGCGTVSNMESAGGAELFDASNYSRVTILDFVNSAPTESAKKEKIDEHNAKVDIATRLFADKIASKIRAKGIFDEVLRGEVEGDAIVIEGAITRYEEGSALARLMIGLGAGSSYFDADVEFKSNLSGEDLAILKVDKNSWVLGGGLAAGQTVEGYMNEAAKKIAEELEKSFVLVHPAPMGE